MRTHYFTPSSLLETDPIEVFCAFLKAFPGLRGTCLVGLQNKKHAFDFGISFLDIVSIPVTEGIYEIQFLLCTACVGW